MYIFLPQHLIVFRFCFCELRSLVPFVFCCPRFFSSKKYQSNALCKERSLSSKGDVDIFGFLDFFVLYTEIYFWFSSRYEKDDEHMSLLTNFRTEMETNGDKFRTEIEILIIEKLVIDEGIQ